MEPQLEAVIVLSEIRDAASTRRLEQLVRDPAAHTEIRAGAAWGLGELRSAVSIECLISAFGSLDDTIRAEAARALLRIANDRNVGLTETLKSGNSAERAGVAWVLGRVRDLDTSALIEAMVGDEARRWVAYVLGSRPEAQLVDLMETLSELDPQVYFGTTLLWQIASSWVAGLEEY